MVMSVEPAVTSGSVSAPATRASPSRGRPNTCDGQDVEAGQQQRAADDGGQADGEGEAAGVAAPTRGRPVARERGSARRRAAPCCSSSSRGGATSPSNGPRPGRGRAGRRRRGRRRGGGRGEDEQGGEGVTEAIAGLAGRTGISTGRSSMTPGRVNRRARLSRKRAAAVKTGCERRKRSGDRRAESRPRVAATRSGARMVTRPLARRGYGEDPAERSVGVRSRTSLPSASCVRVNGTGWRLPPPRAASIAADAGRRRGRCRVTS